MLRSQAVVLKEISMLFRMHKTGNDTPAARTLTWLCVGDSLFPRCWPMLLSETVRETENTVNSYVRRASSSLSNREGLHLACETAAHRALQTLARSPVYCASFGLVRKSAAEPLAPTNQLDRGRWKRRVLVRSQVCLFILSGV